jgi:hypothetical protein
MIEFDDNQRDEIDAGVEQEQGDRITLDPGCDNPYDAIASRSMRMAAFTDRAPALQKAMLGLIDSFVRYCSRTNTPFSQPEISTQLTERGRIVASIYRK